jgi:bifunctional DNA-binding transcriptional regulator/antitoxin component of YhaV-PrlF toxin-antitoxin module
MAEQPKTFTSRVQVGNRIQIPDPLRDVMNIKEGDFLEVTIKKVSPKPEEAQTKPPEPSR